MAGVKGRSGSGGVRRNAGRKSKAEELGLAALLEECWTQDDRKDCITQLASKASDGDMESIKLLMAYAYGKPVDRKEIGGKDGAPIEISIVSSIDKIYGNPKART